MRRLLYGLRMGNNNSYCLLFWMITGFLFLLAIFVTIAGKSVFQPYKQARQEELAPAQTFEEKLANFRADKGFKTNKELGLKVSDQEARSRRNWIPMLTVSLVLLLGLMFSIRRRTRCIGVPLLVIGALGLFIVLLLSWRYGAISLWAAFGLSFLTSLIYTPIAFRDEAEELYERARRQQVARTQTNSFQDSELSFGKIFTAAFLADASVHLGEKILKKLKK